MHDGQFDKALTIQSERLKRIEAADIKRDSKPGKATIGAYISASWYALISRQFSQTLTYAERGHELAKDNLPIETNHAHALMFLGRASEAKQLYLSHIGQHIGGEGSKLWEAEIANDFNEFRKYKLTHPQIAEIEALLGIAGKN